MRPVESMAEVVGNLLTHTNPSVQSPEILLAIVPAHG
jgi:hypothetical protein